MKIQKIFNSAGAIKLELKAGIKVPSFWSESAASSFAGLFMKSGKPISSASSFLKEFAKKTAGILKKKDVFDDEQDAENFAAECFYMLSRQVAMPPSIIFLKGHNENALPGVINLANLLNQDFNFNATWFEQTLKILTLTLYAYMQESSNEIKFAFTNFASLSLLKKQSYHSNKNIENLTAISLFTLSSVYGFGLKLKGSGTSSEFDLKDYFENLTRIGKRKSTPDLGLKASAIKHFESLACEAKNARFNIKFSLSFEASDETSFILDAHSLGLENYHSFIIHENSSEEGEPNRKLNFMVAYALHNLKYNEEDLLDGYLHIMGHKTLKGAPLINHQTLFPKGFGALALNRLELYAPQAINIKNIFNQWILGHDFCTKVLKCRPLDLNDYSFNMLSFLGFSDDEINQANGYVCGHADLSFWPKLSPKVKDCYTIDEAKNETSFAHLKEALAKLNYDEAMVKESSNIISLKDHLAKYTQKETLQVGKVNVELEIIFDKNGVIKTLKATQTGLAKTKIAKWEMLIASIAAGVKSGLNLKAMLPAASDKTMFAVAESIIQLLQTKYLKTAEMDVAKVVGLEQAIKKSNVPQLDLPL